MVWSKAQHTKGLANGGDEMKGVSGLKMMVFQGTHGGIITVGRNGRELIVAPTHLFIAFSLVLGFLAVGQGFNPFPPLS